MKVDTPLGTYPVEFVGLEPRKEGLAVLGRLAGLRSDVLLGPLDLCVLATAATALVGAGAGLAYLRNAGQRAPAQP
jgi:hypothetical protein